MVKEISDKYVFKNDLTLLSAVERYIAFAPQIKKRVLLDLSQQLLSDTNFLKRSTENIKSKRRKIYLLIVLNQ